MSRLRSEIESGRDRARRWAGPTRADEELAQLAKALGHPVRAAIVRLLNRQGECSCGEIVDVLPLAQATISQHLKVLKDAGLLLGEVDGPRVCYCVNPDVIQRIRHLVGEL
jgi:ArsR family transcriptional regulator